MKIQVLELPMQHSGEHSTTPYALIVSEAPREEVDAIAGAFTEIEGAPWEWHYVTSFEVEL